MSHATAHRAARELREILVLGQGGPIDIVRAVESVGARVVLAPTDAGPDGFYARIRGEHWIYGNTFGSPGSRWLELSRLRFTLAHELGHLRLDHGPRVDEQIQASARTGIEGDANQFAAELLVPLSALARLWEDRGADTSDLDAIVQIAARFGVSCQVVLYRLDTAGFVHGRKTKILRELEQKQHLTPMNRRLLRSFADVLSASVSYSAEGERTRLPSDLSERVYRAWEFGVINTEAAADLMRTDVVEFTSAMRRMGVEADGDQDHAD